MKKQLLSCFAVLTAFCASAQNGFFLRPSMGIGSTTVVEKDYGGIPAHKSILGTDLSIAAGYRFNDWRFAAGVSYLATGYERDLTFANTSGTAFIAEYGKLNEYFPHVMIPLTVGYQFRLTPKLLLIPAIGAELSYNAGEKETLTGQPDRTLPDTTFNNKYHRWSMWATASANAEYTVSKQFSIFAGPSAHLMLSNMFKVPAGAPYNAAQHHYAYLLDVGVTWFTHKKVKAAAVVK